MTRINLLPPEMLERQRARRQTTVVAAIGLVVILLLGGFWFMQQLELSGVQRDLDAQLARNAELQAEVDELSRFDEILAEIADKEELLGTLMRNEVRWSGVLRDLSLVIPGRAWLTVMTASVDDPSTGGVPGVGGEGIIGQISFTGFADRHPTVAEWLTALEKIRGMINPWISSSSLAVVAEVPAVTFTSTVDLTEEITVEGRRES
ncbi:MAG: PilN domain-containing protein [Actinomycetota bacterium]